ETMYEAKGVGLAATQVNIHQRMLVADVSDERDQPLYLVNPEIVARDGLQESEEGCLSVPGFYESVRRAE
ncbi:MAG TPA: peptide deformylase, partial [Gammaproteobacteria bacterium]|nr:peptide deformylase [Gammaproteobacteria bacterium]